MYENLNRYCCPEKNIRIKTYNAKETWRREELLTQKWVLIKIEFFTSKDEKHTTRISVLLI
jgi:hypothetical protein